MKTVAIIPVRLQSSRLPQKALIDICGLPMVVHVLKRTMMAKKIDKVLVATDSVEILDVVTKYGGQAIMTSAAHQTGTDRIAEAAADMDCDIVINVQGDEALVNPQHIDAVTSALLEDPLLDVAVLVTPFRKYGSVSDIKAVLNEKNDVLYFSRSDIPSDARTPNPDMLKVCHIVPFRKRFLLDYARWEKGYLEKIEYNEYLRILEKGYRIRAVHIENAFVSVDTMEDLEAVRFAMKDDALFRSYAQTHKTY